MGGLDMGPISANIPPKWGIVEVTVKNIEVGLNRSTNLPCSMLDKLLMLLREVDVDLGPALLPPIIQVIMVDNMIFYSYGYNRSGHRYHTSQFLYITMMY